MHAVCGFYIYIYSFYFLHLFFRNKVFEHLFDFFLNHIYLIFIKPPTCFALNRAIYALLGRFSKKNICFIFWTINLSLFILTYFLYQNKFNFNFMIFPTK